jgi:predicted negative regulator of RcsB-dependent stress response
MGCRVKPGNDEGKVVLAMTRERILFLILGALVVAVIVLGYQVYQDRKKTTGIDINIGERGISIEKK